MKRFLYIIICIIIIAVVAILVLFLWRNAHPAVTTTTGITTGSLPNTGTQSNASSSGTSGNGTSGGGAGGTSSAISSSTSGGATSFGVVDSDPTLNYFVDAQNNLFGVKTDGTIEEITNGQSSELSSSSTANIISANFSYDGKKILLLSGNQNDPQASVFDIASRTWTVLPTGLVGAAWSPTNYQVAYLASAKTGTTIATFDVSNPKKPPVALVTVTMQDISLQWPTSGDILLADKPSAQVGTSLLLWNAKMKTLSPLVFEENGLETMWTGSTSSTQPLGLIFSGDSGGGGYSLQLDSLTGNLLETLSFVTLPSKCLFNTNTETGPVTIAASSTTATSTNTSYPALYCGIPRDQSSFESASLPDNYDQMALFTSDDIYKINVLTGATDVLWSDQSQNVDASDLKFANGNLFFINRYDQKVYALTFAANS